jgi:hypothetical protein
MSVNGITTGTPSKIPFGAGVYFTGLTYSETVAPTKEEILAKAIGATQEGGTLTITPEFFAPELDGANVAIAELQKKVGETAQIETSIAEFSADLAAKFTIGKTADSEDANYDVVTSAELGTNHFYKGFGYYGELLDGRPVIIIFKNALCTSGFTMEPKDKTNAVFKGTFACMSDIAYGTDKLPYAIFVHKKDKWTQADPIEITA